MKACFWLTVLALGWVVSAASGMTELETLRQRCADQEQQIRQLEEDNLKLRAGKTEPQPTTNRTAKTAAVSNKQPTTDGAPKATPVATSAKASSSGGASYTVREKDSFDKIARKNGTTTEALAKANGLQLTTIIHPGQKLKIPGKAEKHTTTTPATAPPPKKAATPPDAKPPVPETPPAAPKDQAPAPASPAATPHKSTPAADSPPAPSPSNNSEKKTHAVKIENEMTYGEFAAKHGTDIKRLNDLNGLDLQKSTVLAKGSELYVPGKP